MRLGCVRLIVRGTDRGKDRRAGLWLGPFTVWLAALGCLSLGAAPALGSGSPSSAGGFESPGVRAEITHEVQQPGPAVVSRGAFGAQPLRRANWMRVCPARSRILGGRRASRWLPGFTARR